MSIGIYVHPASMTTEQYDDSIRRLEAAGAGKPKGRLFHSCFGESGGLSIYDVWESEADFNEFGKTLLPILTELGLDMGKPDVVPMHNMVIG